MAVAAREQGVLLYNVQGGNAQQIFLHTSFGAERRSPPQSCFTTMKRACCADLEQGELDRLSRFRVEREDIDFDGQTIAVGMGAMGVAVLDWSGEQLRYRGQVELSGAALSVSQDEQHLWVGSWESVALISLADERPIVLGQEQPRSSAMAIAGGERSCHCCGLYYVTNLELEPKVWSAVAAMLSELCLVRTIAQPYGFATKRCVAQRDL